MLNGERAEVPEGASVASVLAGMGLAPDERGVAVAVDGEVIPRAQWESFGVQAEARVEVLTAMQGG